MAGDREGKIFLRVEESVSVPSARGERGGLESGCVPPGKGNPGLPMLHPFRVRMWKKQEALASSQYVLTFPVFSPLEGVGGDKVAGRCGVSPHGGWRKTKKLNVFLFNFFGWSQGGRPPSYILFFILTLLTSHQSPAQTA